MFSKLFVIMTVVAMGVNAQSSSDTASSANPSASSIVAGLTPCILACIQPAATQNGCAFTDAQCVCASAQFQADAGQCLQAHCSSADQQAALALQSSQCGAIGVTATGSATGVNTVPFSSAATAAPTTSGASHSASTTGTGSNTSNTSKSVTTPGGSSTSSSAPANTSKAGALSLVANNGVGAVFGAMLAGVLAL